MGRTLYFDCSAGAAGDMVLGALLDAGVPLEALRAALGSLLPPGWSLDMDRVTRAGVGAAKFRIRGPEDGEGGLEAHQHQHRTVAEICALVEASALSSSAKSRACGFFRRLAEVEAAVHRMSVEQVHLHEVGALDSIVDIAGSVFAIEWLAPERVVASPLNVGGGFATTSHGPLPVPAPATAALLVGVPVYSDGVQAERVTPTGALLVSGHADGYGPLPAMIIDAVGYGAGDRDIPGTPNVFRVFVGRTYGVGSRDRVLVMECEIDDMSPQVFGLLMERLYAAGALEVFYTAVQMKKNRPGILVTVLAKPEQRDALGGIIFRETTSIGLRYQEMDRLCLDREVVSVDTPLGPVRFKVARLGGDAVNAAPEFEDCARLAREHGVPVKEVQAVASQAYRDRARR